MSKHEIYDIGNKILFETCCAAKMLFSFCKSMIPVRICTNFCVDSEFTIKTRFKAFCFFCDFEKQNCGST